MRMMEEVFEPEAIEQFIADNATELIGSPYQLRPLHGGLEASVALLDVQSVDAAGPRRFVVKKLEGVHRREAEAYRSVSQVDSAMAPRLHAITEGTRNAAYLFLDCVDSHSDWPWQELSHAESLIEQLARLHAAEAGPLVGEWDYDAVLQQSASDTFEFLSTLRRPGFEKVWRRRRSVEVLANDLPQIREWIRSDSRFPPTLIHGDAHPGNAIVCSTSLRPVLIDWGRARTGSPLEDLSSWLQSLGCWEPRARRSHDRLFRHYLKARNMSPVLTREVRDHYWIAAACNVLAGALKYHLWVACEAGADTPEFHHAMRLAEDSVRIIHRAHVCWKRAGG